MAELGAFSLWKKSSAIQCKHIFIQLMIAQSKLLFSEILGKFMSAPPYSLYYYKSVFAVTDATLSLVLILFQVERDISKRTMEHWKTLILNPNNCPSCQIVPHHETVCKFFIMICLMPIHTLQQFCYRQLMAAIH